MAYTPAQPARTVRNGENWERQWIVKTFSPCDLEGDAPAAIAELTRQLTELPTGYTVSRLAYEAENRYDSPRFLVIAIRPAHSEEIRQAEEEEQQRRTDDENHARRQYEELKRRFEKGK